MNHNTMLNPKDILQIEERGATVAGVKEQIEHFSECVQNGLTESPAVPPAQTLRVIGLSDEIRKTVGVVYPQDQA